MDPVNSPAQPRRCQEAVFPSTSTLDANRHTERNDVLVLNELSVVILIGSRACNLSRSTDVQHLLWMTVSDRRRCGIR